MSAWHYTGKFIELCVLCGLILLGKLHIFRNRLTALRVKCFNIDELFRKFVAAFAPTPFTARTHQLNDCNFVSRVYCTDPTDKYCLLRGLYINIRVHAFQVLVFFFSKYLKKKNNNNYDFSKSQQLGNYVICMHTIIFVMNTVKAVKGNVSIASTWNTGETMYATAVPATPCRNLGE